MITPYSRENLLCVEVFDEYYMHFPIAMIKTETLTLVSATPFSNLCAIQLFYRDPHQVSPFQVSPGSYSGFCIPYISPSVSVPLSPLEYSWPPAPLRRWWAQMPACGSIALLGSKPMQIMNQAPSQKRKQWAFGSYWCCLGRRPRHAGGWFGRWRYRVCQRPQLFRSKLNGNELGTIQLPTRRKSGVSNVFSVSM